MFYEDLSIESCVDELKAVRDDMKILKKKEKPTRNRIGERTFETNCSESIKEKTKKRMSSIPIAILPERDSSRGTISRDFRNASNFKTRRMPWRF